jgi:hypothetical protein
MTAVDDSEARRQKVYDEAVALWRELYGEPPPVRAPASALLDMIMRGLPETGYDRLRSPYLRPANITGPRYPAERGQRPG